MRDILYIDIVFAMLDESVSVYQCFIS